MAVEVGDVLESTATSYEEMMSSIPAEGLKNVMMRSAYSRIIEMLSKVKSIYNRSLCLAKATDKCVKGDLGEYCTTDCGNLGLITNGRLVIFKFGSNAFSITLEGGNIAIKSKRVSLDISSNGLLKIVLPGSTGEQVIEINMRNSDEVYENLSLMKYSLRLIEALLGKVEDTLSYCAKTRMIAC
ncbi:MAG: hypothetical protein GSR83_02120 [Desulfurococcales archaeon]|nr:hypothetical protein [Desulfurococcales archaeon]